MAFRPSLNTTFLLFTIIIVLLPVETYAFGAGDIPDFAYLNDKAFRHGDIESILENVVKSAGGAAAGGGLLGFAHSVISNAAGGAKFNKSDVKRVYFGNWLRDYSQAMDIAGLSKLTADSLVLIVSVLGFMTFGFATEEFQVTADRLGVYLPIEHIDNPKGYAAKEGDARQFHPKLRPPVDDRELEIDERTGMKNYMATEDQGWDSSTAFIRRTFRACIEAGRRAGGREDAYLWEAYRLLGTGLHTMEDLLAHSNWCEVALRKMGHEDVFCHVGDDVSIQTPNGPAPPLITGTFGGADFIFSLMGEATDKLSQASVTDLSAKMDQASQGDSDNASALKAILGKLPIGGSSDDKMNQSEEIHAQSKAYHFDPDNIAPPEVQQQLLSLLKWRDGVYRDVLSKIEMVPGLTDLIDELTNALNAYVYTILSPYIAPILQQATGVLGQGSKAVIDSEDQFEVFNNPNASDPTHSFLSKDHFDLILNEPAGKIAQIVVEHSVNLIVPAWADDSDPDRVIDQILEAFHHPYYATGQSNIQNMMFDHMERWIGGMGSEADQIIQALSKDSVRNGQNKRPGSESETHVEPGYGGHSHGTASYRPAAGGGSFGGQQTQSSYSSSGGGRTNYGESYSSRNDESSGRNTYGRESEGGYGSRQSEGGYDSSRRSDNDDSYGRNTYGQQTETTRSERYGQEDYSSRREDYSGNTYESGGRNYGDSQREDSGRRSDYETSSRDAYGRQDDNSYSQRDEYSNNTYGRTQREGEGRRSEYETSGRNTYGDSERTSGYGGEPRQESYGRQSDQTYGEGRRRGEEETSGRYAPSYGQSDDTYGGNTESLGENQYGRTQEGSYGSSRNRGDEEYGSSGYGGGSYGGGGYEGGNTYGSGGGQGEGYTPSYGRGNEETYGAERLNIGRDDSDEDNRRRHHGHHGHRHNRSDEEG